MTLPSFETNRLTLRPMRPDDRGTVFKIFVSVWDGYQRTPPKSIKIHVF